MPRREDERQLNLTGQHPAYCTCTQCTQRFLRKKGAGSGKFSGKKLFGKAGGEKVRAHPADCVCATCNLLRSVGDLPPAGQKKPGLLQKLFGKQ